jgi:hypothetical protein
MVMSTSEGKPTLIIGEYSSFYWKYDSDFSLVERQSRGSLHFHLIEDPNMNAVMYGGDVYTAGEDLYFCPTKMTGISFGF